MPSRQEESGDLAVRERQTSRALSRSSLARESRGRAGTPAFGRADWVHGGDDAATGPAGWQNSAWEKIGGALFTSRVLTHHLESRTHADLADQAYKCHAL